MKKALFILSIAGIVASCNSGNEGSDSLVIDSVRLNDSTRMADSLRAEDSLFNIMDGTNVDAAQQADTTR